MVRPSAGLEGLAGAAAPAAPVNPQVQQRVNTHLNRVNSLYIILEILKNLKKGKALNIVKYNKNIKNRININIDDYKEYSEIEIEIKPVSNKYGEFINIKPEEGNFYHIYFNNSEEEIKRNYIKKGEKVEIIKIIIALTFLSYCH